MLVYSVLLNSAKLDHKTIILYTVNMLKNCKISQYKIKKILNCFAKDYTSTEASKLTKLDRKTVNRYYSIFRKITLQLFINSFGFHTNDKEYIGYIKGEYGPKAYFNIYKINEKNFLFVKLKEKPKDKMYAIHDKDFNKALGFIYSRFTKFYGFTTQSYYYQLFETMLRYNHSEEELLNLIWKNLKKIKS